MDVLSSQRKILRGTSSQGPGRTNSRTTSTPRTMMTRSSAKKATHLQDEVNASLDSSRSRGTTPRRRRSSSEPPSPRKRIIEDYYRVDRTGANNKGVVLPGVPTYGDDWARDLHDFFNLIALVPVIVLNIMNWDWDMLLNFPKNKGVADAWTGEWQTMFLLATIVYFLVDMTWVLAVPRCVRSPTTIVQHHIATLFYLYVPYSLPEFYCFMGACMSVEINTWFLIARRVFNKQGFSPWVIDLPPLISIRVKLISIFFYITWILIRCVLYPYLMLEYIRMFKIRTEKLGTYWGIFTIALPLHGIFCLLNLKWSYDLLMSKIRYWRRASAGSKLGEDHSKGL